MSSEPWDGAGPLPGLIEGYCSVVQDPRSGEIRIFYDTFGEYGRFLCVAVSKDGGQTFTKPKLGLNSFAGSTENNIVLGKEENSTALAESIEPGTVFIDTNPACPASERWKMASTERPRCCSCCCSCPSFALVVCFSIWHDVDSAELEIKYPGSNCDL